MSDNAVGAAIYRSICTLNLPITCTERSFNLRLLKMRAIRINHDCPSYSARPRPAFAMGEILICVAAIGVLATVVLPQLSSAKEETKQKQLKGELRSLRTQIAVFRAQHQNVPPGYPWGNPLASPTEQSVLAQLMFHTDATGIASKGESDRFRYGPYLSHPPLNPVNGLSTFVLVGNNQPLPRPDGLSGWIYKPQTQEIIPNIVGNDENGSAYATY
jgi:general secretion pathway protein G